MPGLPPLQLNIDRCIISALFCVEFPQVQNIDFSVKDYILKSAAIVTS